MQTKRTFPVMIGLTLVHKILLMPFGRVREAVGVVDLAFNFESCQARSMFEIIVGPQLLTKAEP